MGKVEPLQGPDNWREKGGENRGGKVKIEREV